MTSFTTHIKRAGLAVVLLSSWGVMQSAMALGTPSGTDITNSAQVDYKVGGVDQTQVTSNTTTFKIDRKVDLTVVNNGGANITTSPGAANVAAIFTVSNTGNGTDSFTLAPSTQGGTFTAQNLRIYMDSTTSGPNAGIYDASDTLVTTPISFNADDVKKFFIVSDIPLSATNGQTAVVRLTATTTSTQTAGADNPAVVDVVFADAGRDGIEFASDQYIIQTATLAVVKSSAVLADPINCVGGVGTCGANSPKAIPGATIEYTIVVTNSGTADATSVMVSDTVPTNSTYVVGSMTLNAASLTDAADADAGTFNGTKVSVTVGTVAQGGGTGTVKFRTTIN